jgi:hypothetical protein
MTIIAFCMMTALLALGAPAAQEDSPDARELRQLETVWNSAHLDRNGAALATLWADDLEVAVPKMRGDVEVRRARLCQQQPDEIRPL